MHFLPTDFDTTSRDKQGRRVARRESVALGRRYLKPNAFPSIFPGLPSHLQKTVPAERSTGTSSAARREREVERQEAASEDFLAMDKVFCVNFIILQVTAALCY